MHLGTRVRLRYNMNLYLLVCFVVSYAVVQATRCPSGYTSSNTRCWRYCQRGKCVNRRCCVPASNCPKHLYATGRTCGNGRSCWRSTCIQGRCCGKRETSCPSRFLKDPVRNCESNGRCLLRGTYCRGGVCCKFPPRCPSGYTNTAKICDNGRTCPSHHECKRKRCCKKRKVALPPKCPSDYYNTDKFCPPTGTATCPLRHKCIAGRCCREPKMIYQKGQKVKACPGNTYSVRIQYCTTNKDCRRGEYCMWPPKRCCKFRYG